MSNKVPYVQISLDDYNELQEVHKNYKQAVFKESQRQFQAKIEKLQEVGVLKKVELKHTSIYLTDIFTGRDPWKTYRVFVLNDYLDELIKGQVESLEHEIFLLRSRMQLYRKYFKLPWFIRIFTKNPVKSSNLRISK